MAIYLFSKGGLTFSRDDLIDYLNTKGIEACFLSITYRTALSKFGKRIIFSNMILKEVLVYYKHMYIIKDFIKTFRLIILIMRKNIMGSNSKKWFQINPTKYKAFTWYTVNEL